MAGIYDRLKPEGPHGDGTDRLNAHLFDSAFLFTATGDFTNQQALSAINSTLNTPLSGDELVDLSDIQSELNSQGTTLSKLVYYEKIAAVAICVEVGVMGEAAFRSTLKI